MKNIGIVLVGVVLILVGMNQYESYKLTKTANDGIEAMQEAVKGAHDAQSMKNTTCLKMNDLRKRFDMFKLDNGSYPATSEGVEALVANPSEADYPYYRSKPYLKNLPKDLWENSFSYTNIGNSVELISFGADGTSGGSGVDKDIYLSQCN